jgi:CubicO group peptidase (beta-lactamase class C family)
MDEQIPLGPSTLFRIASMTKPITTTAALTLYDEGRFTLSEPITRWAPEFSDMQVLHTPNGALDQCVPARRLITMGDLLTHRSGLTYGSFHSGPIARAYAEALGGDIDSSVVPDDWIAHLAALPLIDQPGRCFHYSHSTDLLGFILERMEGVPLGELLSNRVFEPLGMRDTGFLVPASERHRRALLYGFDAQGRLIHRQTGPGASTVVERPFAMQFVSGGQGLWSTASDYLRFARIFVGNGTVDGVRILKPETLTLMRSNQLSPAQREEADVAGLPLFASGHGFGIGVATVMEPEKAAPTVCGGGRGAVGWPGGFGGWWQADPNDGSVRIFLTHNIVELEQLRAGVGLGVFKVITDFQRLLP